MNFLPLSQQISWYKNALMWTLYPPSVYVMLFIYKVLNLNPYLIKFESWNAYLIISNMLHIEINLALCNEKVKEIWNYMIVLHIVTMQEFWHEWMI
jgi:hypothetical protein